MHSIPCKLCNHLLHHPRPHAVEAIFCEQSLGLEFLPSPQLWRFSNFPSKQKHSQKQMSICIETSSLSSERVRKRTKMLTALIVIDGRRLEVNFYLCESRDKRNLAKNSSMCRRKMIYQKHMKVINYYQAPLSCLLTSTITADILSALLDKTTKLLFYCPCGRQMTRNGMEKPERIFCLIKNILSLLVIKNDFKTIHNQTT